MEAGARSKGLCGESLYTMWGQTGKAVQLAQATVEGTRSYQTQNTPQLNSIQFYKQLLIQHSLCLLAPVLPGGHKERAPVLKEPRTGSLAGDTKYLKP